MLNKRKKSGFTLIEIVVVLIIVGVLAAIALPSLFGNIAKSKGAEATASLNNIKSTVEGCLQLYATTANAIAICQVVPTATTNFTYAISGISNVSTFQAETYQITATPSSGVGAVVNSSIVLTRVSTTIGGMGGTFTCSGTGSFAGIC